MEKCSIYKQSDYDINTVVEIKTEEKPYIALKCIESIFNVKNGKIVKNDNNICEYIIIIGEKIIPCLICDSLDTSPDMIIIRENNIPLFIEITKGSFKDSGNNIQYQRFTKFIPVLKKDYEKIYYLDTEDISLSGKNELAMICWKINGIILKTNNNILQKYFDDLDISKYTINKFSEEWNRLSKKSTSGAFKGKKQNIEILDDTIIVSNFNVLKGKKAKLTHDPGIGTIMLVISTLLNYNVKRILVKGQNLTQKIIDTSKKNKFIRFICYLRQIFNVEIIIENVLLPNYDLIYNSLNIYSTSEKCVSIHEELLLINNQYEILYTNHARGEQEYLIINGNKISIKKSVYKPDIIYVDKDKKIIWFVEAEKSKNYNKGVLQIQSWCSEITKNYYKKQVEGTEYNSYNFKAYIILYDEDNKCTYCNKKYVKKIVTSSRITYENSEYEYIDLF